jgi:hydroxyacylglutathione hydrolase
VASAGEAIVIDPERKVDNYLDFIARHHLQLKGIFLTHPHADFVAARRAFVASRRSYFYCRKGSGHIYSPRS